MRLMATRILVLIGWACLVLAPPAAVDATDFLPKRFDWASISATEAGFQAARLERAVALARAKAVVEPADLNQVLLDTYTAREPDYRVLGPTAPRAGDSGLILAGGRVLARWGDIERVDMTFSVVKSYLGTLAGLAVQRGLIESLDDPLARYVTSGEFDGEHNSKITWTHLLQQTSDWSGQLWEIHDWADRPTGDDPAQWPHRELNEPGTFFKYNDVRVNLLAYSLLQVFRQPLPVVLREAIMDPIGASNTWRWHGYRNSWVELDGIKMQSVSGGGHFGGGLFISTADHARFGLLMLNRGRWGEQRLIDEDWFEQIATPAPTRPDYGYLWWLNTERKAIPSAPESAYWAAGFGGNYIYIDECNDLVVVLRWIPAFEEVIEAILDARTASSQCREAA